MSKPERYTPPALPEDVLPDLEQRIADIRARWEQHKKAGYAAFQMARAQQAAADDALQRGNKPDHDNLMNGMTDNEGNIRVVGVKALDARAMIEWSQARRYKAELDALTAEQAAQKTAE